jgi:hypothetical protein
MTLNDIKDFMQYKQMLITLDLLKSNLKQASSKKKEMHRMYMEYAKKEEEYKTQILKILGVDDIL